MVVDWLIDQLGWLVAFTIGNDCWICIEDGGFIRGDGNSYVGM